MEDVRRTSKVRRTSTTTLMRFYHESSFPTIHVQNSELAVLPIRRINFDDPGEKAEHDHIAALVTEMLEVQKERAEVERTLDDRRHRLARRIEELDKAINAAVYKLYGLTGDEIKVVGGK